MGGDKQPPHPAVVLLMRGTGVHNHQKQRGGGDSLFLRNAREHSTRRNGVGYYWKLVLWPSEGWGLCEVQVEDPYAAQSSFYNRFHLRYPVGYESDTLWLIQSVSNTSDAIYRQCTLYKFVTSPLDSQRVYVPPALGNVSRAFESNSAWLSRELRCSCFVGAKEFSLSTTGYGGYSVNAADAFAAAAAPAAADAADANELETLSALNCSIYQAILAQGVCRPVSQHT